MLDLLPCNLREPLDWYPTFETFGLPVALTEIHRVRIVLIVEASLDELLDPKDSRWVQALQLRKNMLAYGGMERRDRLLREDLAVTFVISRGKASPQISSVPYLMKPHSRSSCASFFFPKISTSFAFATPTVKHRCQIGKYIGKGLNTYCGCGMSH